ncbi:permease-like cell division protein FtsX [Anaeromassilibacillus sp. An200]|uniref:permease-like cell division protein FtsX n=1 Tax=Anaeromassilibacillus sp. An200 TaxID=1965587 RepID=UPI000B390F2B|nr:permease-like cell division protein FtsX [Anaeromassilibacillus sp. An200]OUP08292.1 ABC transporter permease [Anaeromassilibacillus sp. An200]
MKLSSLGYLLKEGARNIWSNRTMSFASVGVLVSCLLLTGAAVLFSMNIDSAMQSVEGSNSITVYCTQGLPTLKAVQVGEQIKNLENISECELVPKDQAVEEMLDMLGDNGTVLQGLMGEDNFLPDAYRISLTDLSKYEETAAQITAIEGVEKIIDYSDIANQLTQLDDMVTTVCFWIILLLGVVSLFIIANTIRVALFSRRVEISIMKSVGATNWFVRVPFIVEGLLIGLVSGGLASIILNLAYDSVMSSLSVLSFFTPLPLGPYRMRIVLIFLLAGSAFGVLGGLISIGRYLKKDVGGLVTL